MASDERLSPDDQREASKRALVMRGYDLIASAYAAQRGEFSGRWAIETLSGELPAGARIMDAGCGTGAPIAVALSAAGFQVVGIDLSTAMLGLARSQAPSADLVRMDMAALGFADRSFDGVVASYAVFHVPREQHVAVFASFHRVLRRGESPS